MMGAESNIEWTDATWPIVQGCDYESPGCTHCYVVPLLWRLSHNPLAKISKPIKGLVAKSAAGKLHFTGKVALRHDRLADPLGWKKPRMIFVPSHGDVFHPEVPDDFIDEIFATTAMTPQHDYQFLTKRSTRARAYLSDPMTPRRINGVMMGRDESPTAAGRWPLPNVWLGASTEDQVRFDERWPHLRDTPAAKRFISYEPALGSLDIGTAAPDWLIVGGESGRYARPFDLAWARSILRQCRTNGIAAFVKQMGSYPYDSAGPEFVPEFTGKGSDPLEWPEDLRVRQFPAGFGVRS